MKNKISSRLVKIGLVIVGLFIFLKLISSCTHSKDAFQIVRSIQVTKGNLDVKITAMGTVKPYNRVEIKPPIAGRVEEVLVKEGDAVKQGQIVAWMSSVERAALLDAARAQGDAAFKRWQEAYKPAPMLAPLDGMIIVRAVEPGQTVSTADPVVVISDKLIIEALVDETDLSFIALEQKTEIRLDAYPEDVFWGKVDHITYESQLVNNVNVYGVDIVPDKILSAFRSGMTADVTFIVKERKNILLVPSEAVSEWPKNLKKPEGMEFAVYRKEFGGKLAPVPIRIGESDGRMTEILNGVTEGMRIEIVKKKQQALSTNPFSAFGARKNERKPQS
ncbi:MAG: hypothetical protein A3G33_00145 [Omnitrophica bacterium RIFCSPLOWO2_12_FULL_44_17]|uniref:CzcB-like barrel-sandwich hybrid domain-containing protein n=1 Tax=Candidatus Danuiimicrobium aquiferis TaxID=1801832 RepID=A0A1G1KTE7_9BACT|nr:MAG: hypothetical protein A3B72_00230 [Omnitrophica bacterium RIFCSPHIGHO2_02_FULL_45_28]OGW91649.1 MAG: hypothetical protein A3E74_00245 [Omnitrophica bacterium RIFCSPHIGHO2_12_FULL_44_12]OGW96208.1 MAG: hypothetical protein A3G33_00145 [Omnitrophica bacterium RIFCSPLOWO2_12_FULL_44_17]OGX02120.1 MAG: hypothetical protein A3J12_01725 [Omnitrophica bacterium RIFCSPLOWO2_02_FULL_44_11]